MRARRDEGGSGNVLGGSDASGRDDPVVLGCHPTSGFDDLVLVVRDDFDPLEVDAWGGNDDVKVSVGPELACVAFCR